MWALYQNPQEIADREITLLDRVSEITLAGDHALPNSSRSTKMIGYASPKWSSMQAAKRKRRSRFDKNDQRQFRRFLLIVELCCPRFR